MNIHLDALLNLPGVTIETCTTQEPAIYLRLEVLKDTGECPHCHEVSREVNQVRYRTVRDLSISGRATYLEIPSRQFYCQSCQKYFTETLEFVEPRRAYTRRYEEALYRRVQQSSLTQVGREEGLKFDAVEGIFKHQCSKSKELKPAKKLSIDEFSHRKGRGKFATVISDIEAGELLEVLNTHEQAAIIEALSKLPLEWRQAIEEVSVDMWGGFPKVIQEVFPKARIVTDRFHVMKAVLEDLERVRRQSQKQKVKGARYILGKNAEDLTPEQQEKLQLILQGSKRLEEAYYLKEEFRQIYETQQTPAQAQKQFQDWLQRAQQVFNRCVKTIHNHLEGICNYFLSRTTSGVMEGINNRIKLIKRQAYGFTVFENLRQRLLACFSD